MNEDAGQNLGDILSAAMVAQRNKYEVTIEIQYDGAVLFASGQKINTIKEIRSWTGLGLKDSKDIYEAVRKDRCDNDFPSAYEGHMIKLRMDAQRCADFMVRWYNDDLGDGPFRFEGCKVVAVPIPETMKPITELMLS